LIIANNKISKIEKLLLAYQCRSLNLLQDKAVQHGKIVFGDALKSRRIQLPVLMDECAQIILELNRVKDTKQLPLLKLNSHCQVCEYGEFCINKAKEEDNLSLIRGLSEKEIKKYNNNGIFTVNQMSYTFRLRKTPKRTKTPANPRYFALQALAMRENSIYVHGKPKFDPTETYVFFDIEGIPDRDFYYLIGVLVVGKNEITYQYFWADCEEDQNKNFSMFIEFIMKLNDDIKLFHYGNYDHVAIKKMKKYLPDQTLLTVDNFQHKLNNVLLTIHSHLYFPTYSNSLKDIAQFLGFQWTDKNATGLKSIMWRQKWEENGAPSLKSKLIRYNKEDCFALKQICDFMERIFVSKTTTTTSTPNNIPKIIHTEKLRKEPPKRPIFCNKQFFLSDLEYVNKCSYFDYQREKVIVRTSKRIQKLFAKKKRIEQAKKSQKPTHQVEFVCKYCPHCGAIEIGKRGRLQRKIIDLKFTKSSVRSYRPLHISWYYYCRKCSKLFKHEKWPKDRFMYGLGLMSWTIYHNIICKQEMMQIGRSLNEFFGIKISHRQLFQFKSRLSIYYETTIEKLKDSIIAGPVLYIDETTVNLINGEKGYVWVITSIDKVVFFYRDSRKGDFLKAMLENFSGVLVSDFYSAYDSINCPQQKCWVHLIRDIDDDLLRNPLDHELLWLAQKISPLLKSIVKTIDRYGLNKYHHHKHKKLAENFLDRVYAKSFCSELAQKYQKRLIKNKNKLFTFLNYDQVSWHNNSAEHAIKRFAKYRRQSNGRFTEKSINELLVVFSVIITCEFSNINALKFLLSQEKDIPGL
jgi:predicted RecB family nuclease